jgi:hypothetical protein
VELLIVWLPTADQADAHLFTMERLIPNHGRLKLAKGFTSNRNCCVPQCNSKYLVASGGLSFHLFPKNKACIGNGKWSYGSGNCCRKMRESAASTSTFPTSFHDTMLISKFISEAFLVVCCSLFFIVCCCYSEFLI